MNIMQLEKVMDESLREYATMTQEIVMEYRDAPVEEKEEFLPATLEEMTRCNFYLMNDFKNELINYIKLHVKE